MRKLWKRLVALLVVCLLLIPVGTANAAAPDLNSTYSLTVRIHEEYAEAADYLMVDLYYIAGLEAVDGYDTVSVVPAQGAFGALADDFQSVENGENDWTSLAQKALKIVSENPYEIMPPYSGYIYSPIDIYEAGIYMVVVRGMDQELNITANTDDETGEAYYSTVVNAQTNEYVFAPVLITLPDSQGGSGDWLYDLEISLKMEVNERTQKKLILHKVSDSGVLLPDAEFKLYATRTADTPDTSDTITTYIEGQGYVTLYCIGTYTTDKNGNIVLDAPLLDDNTLYAWVETKAPAGYELDPEPHFFFSYGMIVPNDYTYWINMPGVLDTHLRYDNDNPNATGPVTFNRSAYGDRNTVTLLNNSDDFPQDIYVRVKAYSGEDIALGESLGYFDPALSGDGWTMGDDGYWYYNELLSAGDVTEPLYIDVVGDEAADNNGNPLPRAGRVAIAYDFALKQLDENGNPYADWSLDPLYSGSEELNLNSGELTIRPMAEAKGGYVIDLGNGADVKISGTARYVSQCYYDWDYSESDSYNGITVENTFTGNNPPDDSGVELPSTGGIGTTLFTVIGGGLIAIAIILMIKKRKHA